MVGVEGGDGFGCSGRVGSEVFLEDDSVLIDLEGFEAGFAVLRGVGEVGEVEAVPDWHPGVTNPEGRVTLQSHCG